MATDVKGPFPPSHRKKVVIVVVDLLTHYGWTNEVTNVTGVIVADFFLLRMYSGLEYLRQSGLTRS